MELEAPPQAYSFVAWSLVFRGVTFLKLPAINEIRKIVTF